MRKLILGVFVSIISFQGVGADINSISVFVTEAQSQLVLGCEDNCHIYELDATEKKLEEFFGELPSNEEDAYVFVMEKINTPEWKVYEQEVIESQKSVIKAFEFGIKKYPAIVINDTDVSYGTTDVNQVIQDFFNNKERLND